MSRENDFELSQALSQLKKIYSRGNLILPGTIIAVNDDFTCDVKIGETIQYSVPLRVLTGTQASVYEVPVINSECLFTFRDGNINQPQILFVDQVDELLINCKSLVQFNGGTLGGMVKVIDLVNHVNVLENSLNTLKNIFQSWTPVPNDGGASLKALISSWAAQMITITKRSDLENSKIQQ